MIRNLLNFLSFMAIVNLLAVLIFVAWLWGTDRLSRDRIDQVRELFAITNAEEATRMATEAAQARNAAHDAREQAHRDDPPPSSRTQVTEFVEMREQERQSQERLEQEKRVLLRQLQQARDEIDTTRAAFTEEKAQWEQATAAERERKTDEQFAQTVRLYEGAQPKLAKKWLVNLVADGEVEQAVAYLDAMNARSAGRVIGELKTDAESRLATDLLERLRTFGLATNDSEDEADDNTAFADAAATEPGPG